jgi:hypothetical protein
MNRALYLIILLAGAYIIDHYTFAGKVYAGTTMAVSNLALQADYRVKDFLRPLGK